MALIPGIIVDNFGLSAHLGEKFSSGCNACKRNKWVVIFIGQACNCDCYFCPQTHNKPKLGSKIDTKEIIYTNDRKHYSSVLLIKLKNAVASGNIEAIGYSGGEPFLYLPRVGYFASGLMNINSGLYQYIYTNGVAVTKEALKKIKDFGIEEIRFNLAATNYSEEVIRKMKYVKKVIPFLTIEVPVLRNTYRKLKENIKKFIDFGVDQINLSEFVINQHNQEYFKDEATYNISPFSLNDLKESKVNSQQLLNSFPFWSRHVTYDIIETAAKENWPVTINDCSHLNHMKPSPLEF
jgi:pyruvate formate-lyase activating enzyme-like uncharacterized protein